MIRGNILFCQSEYDFYYSPITQNTRGIKETEPRALFFFFSCVGNIFINWCWHTLITKKGKVLLSKTLQRLSRKYK